MTRQCSIRPPRLFKVGNHYYIKIGRERIPVKLDKTERRTKRRLIKKVRLYVKKQNKKLGRKTIKDTRKLIDFITLSKKLTDENEALKLANKMKLTIPREQIEAIHRKQREEKKKAEKN